MGEALLIAPNREGAKKLNSSVARRISDLKVRSKRAPDRSLHGPVLLEQF